MKWQKDANSSEEGARWLKPEEKEMNNEDKNLNYKKNPHELEAKMEVEHGLYR